MDLMQKLAILGESARYDVSCSTSGVDRPNRGKGVGNASIGGICHTWTEDGRCVSLLKVLLTNYCDYDCAYCANRHSNDIVRAAFVPEELADLTMAFYRRNYIEGLFLSSGVVQSPDHTTELMIRTLLLLRSQHHFNGYIHAKAIPGTAPDLIERLGLLSDRISVNMEQCTAASLQALAPQKTALAIAQPPPLLREHRLYQADWLLRFYHFRSDELLDIRQPDLDLELDPKCAWAMRHLEYFPVELNRADYETLLRVPGIGVRSAQKIIAARRGHRLRLEELKAFNLTLRRASWFITCDGQYGAARVPPAQSLRFLLADKAGMRRQSPLQLQMEDIPGVCPV